METSYSIDQAEHDLVSTLSNIEGSERLEQIKILLEAEEIDLRDLGRHAVAGIPADKGIRARCWQLLLGYLPPRRADWEETLSKRRSEYASFCEDFALSPEKAKMAEDDEPLNDAEDSQWNKYFQDVQEFEQIKTDVQRTHQNHPFFACGTPEATEHQEDIQRLLFVFSKLNPGLHYVQGMNELAAALYLVLRTDAADAADAAAAEADTFFCFVRLLTLSDNRDLYCKTLDSASTGVAAVMQRFMEKLAQTDPSVASHLRKQNVDPHYFAFRWMTVLFAQDVEAVPDILRIWDFLLGDPAGCKEATLRFCCALVLRRRTTLLAAEFPEIIKLLQNCAREEFEVEDAINVAVSLSTRYVF